MSYSKLKSIEFCTFFPRMSFSRSQDELVSNFVIGFSQSKRYRLTHWGRATHICIGIQITISSDNGLSRNQCWNIVNWTLGNKLQWNFNRNSNILIQENAFENVFCEIVSMLSRPQCVNWITLSALIWIGLSHQHCSCEILSLGGQS